MGWLTGSEIYPLAVRVVGTSQSAVLWSTNLLITLTLPSMIEGIGVGPGMSGYAAFNVFTFVFVLLRIPELTGRSLEQPRARCSRDTFAGTTSSSTRPSWPPERDAVRAASDGTRPRDLGRERGTDAHHPRRRRTTDTA
jgi:hypothetical protein